MLTILHGSDFHFGKRHDPKAAEAFVEAVHEVEPDVMVLSGDFTQRAKVEEYRQARAFLDRLPDVPKVVTPGNHDVPLYRVAERLLAPYRNYRNWIVDDLNAVTHVPGATFVALNSTAPWRTIVNGRLTRRQLDFARQAFQDAEPGALRALVLHHHLAPAPDYEGDRPMLRARKTLEAVEEMGVELVMGGHLHRSYIGNSLDVHPGPDRERGVVVVQSGTSTSRRGRARERAKTSFNVLRVGEDRLEVTHHMHFQEVGGFAPFSIHAFPRWTRRYFPSPEPRFVGAPADRAEAPA